MIKAELRDNFMSDIKLPQVNAIIRAANAEIKKMYNIDASEYRGRQIAFYEMIIREEKYLKECIKVVERLKAAERLDKLFGLETIQLEDADAIAERVRAALQAMDEDQISEVPDDAISKLERLRQTYKDSQREGTPEPADASTGQQEPSTSQTADTEEVKPDAEPSETAEGDNSIDIEDVASIDQIPKDILDLINDPKNDKAFEDFEKRKKRRKEL